MIKSKTNQENWRSRAENYLRSFLDTCANYEEEEAVIYFLSRNNNCSEAIENIKSRWSLDESKSRPKHKWRFWTNSVFSVQCFFDATALRMAQWGKINGYSEYWPKLNNLLDEYDIPQGTKLDYYIPFPFYRSDLALTHLKSKLVVYLYKLHEWLIKSFEWGECRPEDGSQYLLETLISAVYIFGCCQLNEIIDKELLNKASNSLIKTQLPNGSWWGIENCQKNDGIYHSAISIHALALAQPEGYEEAIRTAAEWLKGNQNENGSWKDLMLPIDIFTTVLVLDAIELADHNQQEKMLTFTVNQAPISSDEIVIKPESGNLIVLDKKSQTLTYRNKTYEIGGTDGWEILLLLYSLQSFGQN